MHSVDVSAMIRLSIISGFWGITLDNNFNECDTDLKTRHDADIVMLVGLQDWDLNMNIISGFDNHKHGVYMRDLLHLNFNYCEQKKVPLLGSCNHGHSCCQLLSLLDSACKCCNPARQIWLNTSFESWSHIYTIMVDSLLKYIRVISWQSVL